MNKKILVILAVLLCVCMMLAACGEEPAHEHTYDKTAWTSDATMHWHKATCEHSDAMADVQGHIDDDHDGVCDVCQYAGDHTHTFEEGWEYDATGHWHEADCFHDVKDGFAAHTADEMGFCTECGYKVSDPDVSTIKSAIEVAVAQKGTVKHGHISSMDWSARDIDFEYRNGYLYIKEGTTERFYSLTENGQVLGVIRESAWDNISVYRDQLATEDNLDGPEIPGAILEYEISFYGAEDLVSYLYSMGSVDNLNADFTESVENGVYTFGFGYFIENYGLYKITVEFTLDTTTYAFASVNVESVRYAVEDLDTVTEATEDAPATYAPKADAEATSTATVEITQGIDAANPFDPVELLATGFDLVDAEGNTFENDTIYVEKDGSLSVYLGNLTPDSASMDFVILEVAGENVNLEWDDPNWANGLSAFPYEGFIELGTGAAAGTTYSLDVTVNGVTKTYTVVVTEPVPEYIGAGQLGESYGNTTLNPSESVEMTEGDNVVIGAYLDKNAGDITVSITGADVDESKLGSFSFWELDLDTTCYGTSYDLSGLAVGEYVVTFTSTVNADLTVSVNVTVVEEEEESQPPVIPNPPADDDDGLAGSGTIDDPYVLTQSGSYTANVPAEDYVYYIANIAATGSVELSFDPAADWDYNYGTFNFNLCEMGFQPTVSAAVIQGNTFYLKISTYSGEAGQITFEITLPAGSSTGDDQPSGGDDTPAGDVITPAGSGDSNDPFVITQSGSYIASVPTEGEVCYTLTATSDCTVTLSTDGVWWAEYGTYSFMMCDGIDQSGTFSKDVAAGQTLYIKISTLDYAATTTDISFTVTID